MNKELNKLKVVEIARSFSFKLNCGNYQTADFFASQKAECLEIEKEKKSEELIHFCKSEVIKSVNAFKKIMEKHKETYLDSIYHRDLAEESEKVDFRAKEEENNQ